MSFTPNEVSASPCLQNKFNMVLVYSADELRLSAGIKASRLGGYVQALPFHLPSPFFEKVRDGSMG